MTLSERREYSDRPMVGVGAVVRRGDEVLLVRRGRPPKLGEWSLPGGLQELGETVFEAAIREVREETGCEIEIVGLIDAVDLIERAEDGRVSRHYTLIDVAAVWIAGEPRAADDAADARWFHSSEIASLAIWSETLRIIGLSK